jgi:hypothetical protein
VGTQELLGISHLVNPVFRPNESLDTMIPPMKLDFSSFVNSSDTGEFLLIPDAESRVLKVGRSMFKLKVHGTSLRSRR